MHERVRKRLAVGVWAAVVAVALVFAIVAATDPPKPDLELRQPGHWVYGADGHAVYHVDGGTKKVDSRTGEIVLGPNNTIVQSKDQVLVAENGKITEFGKSDLVINDRLDVGRDETPVGLEVVGGPYLVYRQAGTVVRFGSGGPVRIDVGGSTGDPAVTDEGVMWLQVRQSAALCQITRTGTAVVCPATAPNNRVGALATSGTQALFVDAPAGTLTTVSSDGLGLTTQLGTRIPDARVASLSVDGKLGIVDPAGPQLVLADVTAALSGRSVDPVRIPLGDGDFAPPVPTDHAVVVLDRKSNQVLTFDTAGHRQAKAPLPKDTGRARVIRGADGRVYVDGDSGRHTVVVDKDGSVTDVELGGAPKDQPPPSTPPPPVSTPKPPPGNPNSPPAPPGPPGAVDAQPGNAAVTLSWRAADPHNAAIVEYQISWRVLDGNGSPGSRTVGGKQLSVVIGDLRNGTTYVFSVAARNAVGTGPATDSPPARPSSEVPGPPGVVTARANQDGTARVSWDAASGEGRQITHYTVHANGNDGSAIGAIEASGTSLDVADGTLTLGTTYTFTVTATNDAGITSTPSGASNAITPYRPAEAPGNARATGADGTVTLDWARPELNGGELVEYRVSGSGVATRAVNGTQTVYTGLNNGTPYTFQIVARTRQKGTGDAPVDGAPAQATGTPGRTADVGIAGAALTGDRQITVTVSVNDHGSGAVTCHIFLNNVERVTQQCGNGQQFTIGGLAYSTGYSTAADGSNAFGTGPRAGGPSVTTNNPPPSVGAGKGVPRTVTGCDTAACALVNVSMRNFAPNTTYTVGCYDDYPDNGGRYWTYSAKTDGAGNSDSATCVYGYTGHHVWAVVGGVESNHVSW